MRTYPIELTTAETPDDEDDYPYTFYFTNLGEYDITLTCSKSENFYVEGDEDVLDEVVLKSGQKLLLHRYLNVWKVY